MTQTSVKTDQIKMRVAAISIAASGTMAAAKFIVGISIGSLALISEALHRSIWSQPW
jgi:divalent metal cation (Fe/Co/Zn/Cd) transporter